MPIRKTEIPNFFCSDPGVQKFFEVQVLKFNPYDPEATRSGRQLIEAAIQRFGHWRCYDIEFSVH